MSISTDWCFVNQPGVFQEKRVNLPIDSRNAWNNGGRFIKYAETWGLGEMCGSLGVIEVIVFLSSNHDFE